MKRELVSKLKEKFEDCSNESNNIEFWFARDLQKLLDYNEWRNFVNVIEKAKVACKKSGQNPDDHFVDVNKTILMPKGAKKDILDFMLTRYACYLIAQNGDPRKEQIAFARFSVGQFQPDTVAGIALHQCHGMGSLESTVGTPSVLPHHPVTLSLT